MSRADEIAAWMELNPDNLEAVLATEYGATEGIEFSAVHDDRERGALVRRSADLMRARLQGLLQSSQQQIEEMICRRLNYCNRRESAVEVIVVGLLEAGLIELTLMPLPIVGVCVYVVKTRMLDPICKCHGSA